MENGDHPSLIDQLNAIGSSASARSHVSRLLPVIQKIRVPLIVIALCVIGIIGVLTYEQQSPRSIDEKTPTKPSILGAKTDKRIYIDLSGGVVRPGVQVLTDGSRLFEAIERAGGLSTDLDKGYFARNFNQAMILTDGMKIHLPSIYETGSGIYVERSKLISSQSSHSPAITTSTTSSGKISLNTASQSELESLPGVGPVTAARIISARPYNQVDDLVTRDIVKQSLYDKLVPDIDL